MAKRRAPPTQAGSQAASAELSPVYKTVELDLPEHTPERPRRVFIVHGHDEAARVFVARFLERIGFEAVILHERPNKGRTLISNYEEAGDIRFAVVLMTPDDVGGKQGGEQRPRPRQNVIFELAFFIGALGSAQLPRLSKAMLRGRPTTMASSTSLSKETGRSGWRASLKPPIRNRLEQGHAGLTRVSQPTTRPRLEPPARYGATWGRARSRLAPPTRATGRIASPEMLLKNFPPMIGAAPPNRVGRAHGGNYQHGRAARGFVGGGGALLVGGADGRRRRAGFYSAIRREVPIRTFNDWKDPAPGFCEVDMVAHGGTSVAGSFTQTLTTGWTLPPDGRSVCRWSIATASSWWRRSSAPRACSLGCCAVSTSTTTVRS